MKRPRKRRGFIWPACGLIAGFAFLIFIGAGFFAARLAQGPIGIDGLGPLIADALDDRFGHRYEFSVGATAIIKSPHVPTFGIDRLVVREQSGRAILTAPRAEVSIDPFALILGEVRPRRLEIFDVELHLALLPDGSLTLPASPDRQDTQASTQPPETALAERSDAAPPTDPSSGGQGGIPEPQPAAPPRALFADTMTQAIRAWIDMLTSQDSPIAAIDRIGITRGRLVIDDRTTGRTLNFGGVKATFDKSAKATTFNLSVEGPNGRWSVAGLARGAAGTERTLNFSLRNVSLDEILLATGARAIGADFDMPLSTEIGIGLEADGTVSQAAGQFEFGAGYLRFDDPEDEPMMIDKITGGFHWETATRRIAVDPTRLVAGKTLLAFKGSVTPPERDGDPWTLALVNSEPNIAAPERPGQTQVIIARGELAARLLPVEKRFVIDRFAFDGPECGFAMAGTIDWTNGPRVRLGASISPTPVRVVPRLWPSFIVAPVRAWLIAHATEGIVQSGTLQIDLDAPTMDLMRADRAPPDESVLLDFTVSDASIGFLPGVPPLRGFKGIGHITGRTSDFKITNGVIEAGPDQRFVVPEGSFHVADADVKPTPAKITAKVSASLETIASLLSRDALKPFSKLPLDASTLKGEVDGRFELGLMLDPAARPEDGILEIHANVRNFSAEHLIGREGLSDAALTFDMDPAGMRANGQGRIFGAQAQVGVVEPTGKAAKATISLTMDDAMRTSHGFGAVPCVSGPIGVLITGPLATGEKPRAEVELDLGRAVLECPGISKPAGRPGRLSFLAIARDNGTLLDQIAFESGPLEARGAVELGADAALLLARFPVVKLAPGDDMKIDAVRAGDSLKVVVRGSSIDARPFLKSLVFTPRDRPRGGVNGGAPNDTGGQVGAGAAKEIELDVKSALLNGYNKEVVTDAELRFVKRGDEIKQFSVAGRFDREPLSGNLTGASAPQLNLMTADAGSLLSFLDLYKHMEGGRLSVGMRVGAQSLDGLLVIDNFLLRDEPALRRLVTEGVPPPDATGRHRKIDAGAVAFDKLQVRFQRAGSRLDVQDGTMHGEAIGLTVDGWLDYAHDRMDMSGTFVPAYAFNNLFSQIPVFGVILGGGSNEGLFGVNFRIEGKASAPTLSINPLSAIAPGILRQIFGVGDNAAPAGAVR